MFIREDLVKPSFGRFSIFLTEMAYYINRMYATPHVTH